MSGKTDIAEMFFSRLFVTRVTISVYADFTDGKKLSAWPLWLTFFSAQ